jgi:hypothetical protein
VRSYIGQKNSRKVSFKNPPRIPSFPPIFRTTYKGNRIIQYMFILEHLMAYSSTEWHSLHGNALYLGMHNTVDYTIYNSTVKELVLINS